MAEVSADVYQCSVCFYTSSDIVLFLNHPCQSVNSSDVSHIGSVTSMQSVMVSEQPSTSFVADEVTEGNGPLKWNDNLVRLLIVKYQQFKHMFKRPKTTKKQVFDKIASEFNEASTVVVTGEQCMRKWLKLEAKYKEVEDNNKRTGSANRSWKFHEGMGDCLGDSQRVNPAYTVDSSSSAESDQTGVINSEDDDHDEDDDDGSKEKRSKRKRKRKSYSSAAEMLSFLQSYTERREKADEEKLKLLKEMQDKKDKFFGEFLEIMRNK